MKKIISLIFAFITLCAVSCNVSAAVPYTSYTYSTQSGSAKAVYCPTPYYPAKVIDKSSLGTALSSIFAMCFDKEGNLYIVDNGASKVLVLNPDYSLKAVIDEFETDSDFGDFLSAPEGVFVTDDMDIYICDTGNKRIVILGQDYKIKKIIKNVVPIGGNIDSDEDYSFAPTKIVIDSSKNMYVLVKNEYQGIVQLDSEGKFISFLGSNKVTYNPITKIWKSIMSKRQKEQLEQFLPVEYTNLSMDHEGLILTVSKSDDTSPVKRLNLSGKDVLTRNGYMDIVGDVFEDADDVTRFADITGDENGNVYLLDSFKGRVFVYNSEGYLFYSFGSIGTQIGSFTNPSDIELNGTDILVAESGTPRITVFKRTEYANLISEADQAYYNGEYDLSIEKWNRVIKLNTNFELAYAQIGKVYLRQNRYEEAMQYFELGNCRGDTVTKNTGYNKAFAEFRRQVAENWLAPVVITVIAAVGAAYGIKFYRRRKKREGKK